MTKAKQEVETTEGVTHEEHVAETKVNKLDIINGRRPLVIVCVIRFHEDADVKDNVLAKKYHTSAGKISDVRKSRNFTYVDEAYKPSGADIESGMGWAAKMDERGDQDGAAELADVLGELVVATEDESAAFAESRKATRKPRGKKVGAEAPEELEELEELEEGAEDDDLFED